MLSTFGAYARVTLCLMYLMITSAALGGVSAQEGGVTFHDLAADAAAGIDYRRTPSPSADKFDAIKADPPYDFSKLIDTPLKSRGAPGVAIFDFDGDGDQDIYVTNGPGTANSLYSNQLVETGAVGFVNAGANAGATATDQDSTGVCYGDIDNDGDPDLVVLGNKEPNRLFENQGGVFVDITSVSGIGEDGTSSTACAMADVNLDGLLDIAIANAFDMIEQRAIFVEPFALNEPNQLFLNQGSNTFADVSESSGILALDLPVAVRDGAATISWAIALVDIDLDGDADLIQADDQAAIPNGSVPAPGAVDRGYIQIFENDGTGAFNNVTIEREMDRPGSWMGLAFGDYDRNGTLDMFATNFGNHAMSVFLGSTDFSQATFDSRWFLQRPTGTFRDSFTEISPIQAPFGWGASSADYDNDGDTDILFHGGLDQGSLVITAPGVILAGDGAGHFSRDITALAGSSNHVRRNVQGMAVGDLDNNGFVDIASVANFDIAQSDPLTPVVDLGGEFDEDAFILETFGPLSDEQVFAGINLLDGTLSIELSSGDNSNGWVQIETRGSIGVVSGAQVNRNGIGAVVRVTPVGGPTDMRPVLGGSSHASQDSLVLGFGLGVYTAAYIDVLWPGGVRNRLYDVPAGSRLLIPEIPCRFDDPGLEFTAYQQCVMTALGELEAAGILDATQVDRFLLSATRAFQEFHSTPRAR